jgi:membrane protein implicated in regulation of membrane protease activity
MTWSDFYLLCFLMGFGLSVISVLAGSLHVPHFDVHHGLHLHAGGHGGADLPWFNVGTIAAFLAWFGGTGYLLEGYYGVWFVTALCVATLSGIGGAAIVFLFLAKVLMKREAALDPADYDMIGVLGKLSLPIRQNGTGEIIYSQEGVRRVAGARSDDGTAIPRGTEVVVTRYEKGIAYVRRFEDLTDTPSGEFEQYRR